MLANEVIQRDMQNMQQLQGQLDNILVKLQENQQSYTNTVNRYTSINPAPTGKNYFVNNGSYANKAFYGEKNINGTMTFKQYPSSMLNLGYSEYYGYDSSPGQNDIYQSDYIPPSLVYACKNRCNNDRNCGGFVYHGNRCFYKSRAYPDTWRRRLDGSKIYHRAGANGVPQLKNNNSNSSCPKGTTLEVVPSSFIEKGTIVPGYMAPGAPCMLSKATLMNRQWQQGWNAEILAKGNEIVGKLKGLVEKKNLMKKMRTDEKERIQKSIKTYEEIVNKIKDRDARIDTVTQRAKDMALNVGVEHFYYLSFGILLVSILIAMIFIMRKKS